MQKQLNQNQSKKEIMPRLGPQKPPCSWGWASHTQHLELRYQAPGASILNPPSLGVSLVSGCFSGITGERF